MMAETEKRLAPNDVAYNTNSSRRVPEISSTTRNNAPPLDRILSGTHLDDQSHYGHHTHDSRYSLDDGEDGDHSRDSKYHPRNDFDETVNEDQLEKEDLEEGPEAEDDIINDGDIESRPNLEKKKTGRSTRSTRDPNFVGWEGTDDPNNPKNWTMRRKWAATVIVSLFTLISPVSSTMIAPAIHAISTEFAITSTIQQTLSLSVFVLAYAIGPLFFGPLSELYGRVVILQLGNLFYLFFNLACGLAQSKTQIIIFRFLAGLGGSAPLAIGGGVLSDVFTADQRGKAMAIYSLAPLFGPAIGPVCGGFIAEYTTWRWVFYSTTIVDAIIQLAGLFFLQETYPAVLLQRRKRQLIKETGNEDLFTEFDHPNRTVFKTLQTSFSRPFILLTTQPIVMVLALYMAYLYGLLYLVFSTFPVLWEDVYGESVAIGGLNYISIGLGCFLSGQICAPLQDRVYKALKARYKGVGCPEFRVPLMLPGAILVPAGLFLYGWTAQYHTHWIFPNMGMTLFGAGIIIGFQCIQTYIVDSYTRYAASAIASTTVLRSLAGFGFPLFAPYMYQKLDYGWGNSLLGFLAIGIGFPGPILLWTYGEKLRKQSPYAAG